MYTLSHPWELCLRFVLAQQTSWPSISTTAYTGVSWVSGLCFFQLISIRGEYCSSSKVGVVRFGFDFLLFYRQVDFDMIGGLVSLGGMCLSTNFLPVTHDPTFFAFPGMLVPMHG